jgi:hypothetical protein
LLINRSNCRSLPISGETMRVAAVVAIAVARLFPARSLQAKLLEQALLAGGAVSFVWLLSMTRGTDLGFALF